VNEFSLSTRVWKRVISDMQKSHFTRINMFLLRRPMKNVTVVNEFSLSTHVWKRVISDMQKSHFTRINMFLLRRPMTHTTDVIDLSLFTHVWKRVISVMRMSYSIFIYESSHMDEWNMPRMWMSFAVWHMWMRHFALINEICKWDLWKRFIILSILLTNYKSEMSHSHV